MPRPAQANQLPTVPGRAAKQKSAGILGAFVLAVFLIGGIASAASGEDEVPVYEEPSHDNTAELGGSGSYFGDTSNPDYDADGDGFLYENSGDGGTGNAYVVEVVDADTVDVRLADGTEDTVRLIGIDASEQDECYRVSSTLWAEDHLGVGDAITLVKDPTIPNRGRYDRLLRRIEEPEEYGDYGKAALQAGVVRAQTYNEPPHQLADEYEAVEQDAQASGQGLHGMCSESGEYDSDGDGVSDEDELRRSYLDSGSSSGSGYSYSDDSDYGYSDDSSSGGGLPPECWNEIVGNGRGDC